MPVKALRIARLRSAEQQTVAALRAADAKEPGASCAPGLAELRSVAVGTGMCIRMPSSPFVGRDEAQILALLTLFQRQRVAIDVTLERRLRDCLVRCADELNQAGLRLDYRNVARREFGLAASRGNSPKWEYSVCATGAAGDGSLRRRTMRFVGDRLVTSRELQGFGVSRQTISNMFKDGLLRRVRHGVYGAALEQARPIGGG